MDTHPQVAHDMLDHQLPNSRAAMYQAVTGDDCRLIKLLLEEGASGWEGDCTGQTLMHLVNSEEAFKLLWDAGAPVDAKTETGDTPLHTCTNPVIARLLISHGADVNARNADGCTPLHYAKSPSIARSLVDAGANVDSQNGYLHTAFQIACSFGNWQVIRILLENKANTTTCDQYDRTGLDIIEQCLSNVETSQGRRDLLITAQMLRLWQDNLSKPLTLLSQQNQAHYRLRCFDSTCSWAALQLVCRNPAAEFVQATGLPEALIESIIVDYVGPWQAAPDTNCKATTKNKSKRKAMDELPRIVDVNTVQVLTSVFLMSIIVVVISVAIGPGSI